ncbi:MAG: exonuclease domain-containing protein [Bacteroidetes bacterium]|nr:exonuclease domain-containing protein [Bacteroidota bacterium]
MKINLTRPLAFFDLETTGTDVSKDRIVEISIIKLSPNGDRDVKTRRINPGIPIPAGASAVHHIYDEDVKDAPLFKSVAKSLDDFIKNCDLGGFNSDKFDIPLLAEEFMRAGIDFDLEGRATIDIQNIFHKMEQRTLSAGYQFYCNKKIENAHSAQADTEATIEILEAMLDRYKDTEIEGADKKLYKPITNDIKALQTFSKRDKNVDLAGRIVFNEDGVECFNFGKHKGVPVELVLTKEPSYYAWMMNGDFPLYTKKALEKIKLKLLQNKLNS